MLMIVAVSLSDVGNRVGDEVLLSNAAPNLSTFVEPHFQHCDHPNPGALANCWGQ